MAHLIAANFWILNHGEAWVKDLKKLGNKKRNRPREVIALLEAHKGLQYPWLFFGIKSARLHRAILDSQDLGRGASALILKVLRFLWRFFVYPIVICGFILVLSLTGWGEAIKWQMLWIVLLLEVGCVAIAIESLLATQNIGAWAGWYHGLPRRPRKAEATRRSWETLTFWGTFALIAIPCAGASIALAGTLFDAYGSGFPSHWYGRLGIAAQSGVVGIFSFAFLQPTNAIGFLVNAFCTVLSASYLIVALDQR